jgi:uncharacterized protein (UPF0248 family)
MFETIGSKIFSSIVSLSLLLFSSFQGNDPRLSQIRVSKSDSYLYLSGDLISAFENDFPSIFSSGTSIPVHFMLTIKGKSGNLLRRRFTHTVNFDTATGVYTVQKSGKLQEIHSEVIADVIREVSRYSFAIPYQKSWGEVSIKIEAELPRVNFEQLDKEVDLMVLWKHKKPSARANADLRRDQ